MIVILGGGIAGLAAAWTLRNQEVLLLEKGPRVGGWIQTHKEDGFLFEMGPRGFRPHPQTLQLIEELDLSDQLIPSQGTKRYLYEQDKLKAITPLQLLSPSLLKDLFCKPIPKRDETVETFFVRHFGQKSLRLVRPLCRGIFAQDAATLSARSCFPTLWALDQKQGSLLRKRKKKKKGPALLSFKQGMQTLPDRLYEKLQDRIRLNCPVEKVEGNRVHTPDGVIEAEKIIYALPAHALSKLQPIPQIDFVSLTTTSVGFKTPVEIPKGFGFLTPKGSLLGITFDSHIFPQQCTHPRLCIMSYGPIDVKEVLETYLGITQKPDLIVARTAHNAIAHYSIGHHEKLQRIDLPITGSSFFGVGVNDCIAHARSLG